MIAPDYIASVHEFRSDEIKVINKATGKKINDVVFADALQSYYVVIDTNKTVGERLGKKLIHDEIIIQRKDKRGEWYDCIVPDYTKIKNPISIFDYERKKNQS